MFAGQVVHLGWHSGDHSFSLQGAGWTAPVADDSAVMAEQVNEFLCSSAAETLHLRRASQRQLFPSRPRILPSAGKVHERLV